VEVLFKIRRIALILIITTVFGCSERQDSSKNMDDTDKVLTEQDTIKECPKEPISVPDMDILVDAYELIYNSKSRPFGRIYRDSSGCYIRLREPCKGALSFLKPTLRVDCPQRMKDPIFIQCKDSIRKAEEEGQCICNTTAEPILCPGDEDIISYGDITFEGIYNPRSLRHGWIFVSEERCWINSPLQAGETYEAGLFNWEEEECPPELNLKHFESCPKKLMGKDKEGCFCSEVEGVELNSNRIDCPPKELVLELNLYENQ
jgi:hypothetical protein